MPAPMAHGMSLPREVLPGRFYLVTRRCTQRQFLLRPDDATNEAFLYCLGTAAQRFGIDVILPCAMSNHHHTVIFDRQGNYPAFLELFHKLVAKSQNALRGRWENFWSSEQVCVVRLVDPDDVMRKLVYVATNPVKDRLVERVHQWPGVNGLSALLAQRPIRVRRPAHFFRPAGPMPPSVTLNLVVPSELGSRDEILHALRDQVHAVEARVAKERACTGARVLGRRAVLRQSWRESPSSREPRRNLRPRIAARSQWARIEALLRNRAFLIAYREAWTRWIAGDTAGFPVGTYRLRRLVSEPLAN
jgi:REP element-mobilizing transposase RayT